LTSSSSLDPPQGPRLPPLVASLSGPS
jgi:hypothetical protein